MSKVTSWNEWYTSIQYIKMFKYCKVFQVYLSQGQIKPISTYVLFYFIKVLRREILKTSGTTMPYDKMNSPFLVHTFVNLLISLFQISLYNLTFLYSFILLRKTNKFEQGRNPNRLEKSRSNRKSLKNSSKFLRFL